MKKRLKMWLKNGPGYGLLQRIRFKWSPLPRRSEKSYITNVKPHWINDHVVLETYCLGQPFGPCPAASVYIFEDEVMRLDCVEGASGHFHVNLTQARFCPGGEQARLYFPPGTMADHVEQASFQLRHNLDYARRQNWLRRIRAVRIDPAALNQAADWMKEELLRIEKEVRESGSNLHASRTSDQVEDE